MKRSKTVIHVSAVLGTFAVAGLAAAAVSNQDTVIEVVEQPLNPTATLRHLDNAASALAREQDRLARVVAATPPIYPPDPCADPRSNACRQVHAVEAIDASAESFLASVAALDHGNDRAALARRLAYSTASLAWASVRFDALAADFAADRPAGLPPSQYPPDPCGPVLTNIELLASAAQLADRRAGAIDSCADQDSVERRLGHVVVGLDSAAARLDKLAAVGFNPQPDPPGTDVGFNPQPDPPAVAQLDAIIARADSIAAHARALRGTQVSISSEDQLSIP